MNTRNIVRSMYFNEVRILRMMEIAYIRSLFLQKDPENETRFEVVVITDAGEPMQGTITYGQEPDESNISLFNSCIIASYGSLYLEEFEDETEKYRQRMKILINWSNSDNFKLSSQKNENDQDYYIKTEKSIDELKGNGTTYKILLEHYIQNDRRVKFYNYLADYKKSLSLLKEKLKQEFPKIGSKIREHRELSGLSQEELARMVSTTQSQIARYESDQQEPTSTRICELAWALDVKPGDFFK